MPGAAREQVYSVSCAKNIDMLSIAVLNIDMLYIAMLNIGLH